VLRQNNFHLPKRLLKVFPTKLWDWDQWTIGGWKTLIAYILKTDAGSSIERRLVAVGHALFHRALLALLQSSQ